jgi:hypothetical protein
MTNYTQTGVSAGSVLRVFISNLRIAEAEELAVAVKGLNVDSTTDGFRMEVELARESVDTAKDALIQRIEELLKEKPSRFTWLDTKGAHRANQLIAEHPERFSK